MPIEYLEVPSAAMGHPIKVEFMARGPHAVYLLGRAARLGRLQRMGHQHRRIRLVPRVRGVGVVMPVGGESSFYTDWYQPAAGNGTTPNLQMGDHALKGFVGLHSAARPGSFRLQGNGFQAQQCWPPGGP